MAYTSEGYSLLKNAIHKISCLRTVQCFCRPSKYIPGSIGVLGIPFPGSFHAFLPFLMIGTATESNLQGIERKNTRIQTKNCRKFEKSVGKRCSVRDWNNPRLFCLED